MAILPIIITPNPLLKKTSLPVTKIDNDLQKLMNDMLETMYNQKGVGLAAVQVGVLKRVIVMDTQYSIDECDGSHHHHHNINEHISGQKPMFLVNPQIIKSSKEDSVYFEGCLSLPDIRADICRPKMVTIKYLDYNGLEQILEANDLLATCVQHEIDHLNGIIFIDYLSKLKQEIIIKKLNKLS
jgi:peptide deformylase